MERQIALQNEMRQRALAINFVCFNNRVICVYTVHLYKLIGYSAAAFSWISTRRKMSHARLVSFGFFLVSVWNEVANYSI